MEKYINRFWWIILLILLIPAVKALFVGGFYGASDELHVAWLYEIERSLLSGQFPPRFVPDLSFGFGYPLFNFVFPLPFYIAEIFRLFQFNLVDSIKIVFGVSLVLSAFSFVFLLKYLSPSKLIGLSGALLYVYTPYRATDTYVRGAIGECLSFVFLPLVVLAVFKLTDGKTNQGLKWIGIGALSLAGLVLSHNITTYMFLPFAALLAILKLVLDKHKRYEMLVRLFAMGIFGLLISSYFWAPALTESSFMKYDTVFNIKDHFPTLRQLITPYFGYGASVPGPGDGLSFFVGGLNLFLLISAPVVLFKAWRKSDLNFKIITSWILFSTVVAVFFMNHRSSFLWDKIPLLPYFQFPWRFLILTTFLTPLLVVIFNFIKRGDLIIFLLVLISISLSFQSFRPEHFLGRTDQYYLNKYIPAPFAKEEYLTHREEYLRLPKESLTRPEKNYPVVEVLSGTLSETVSINDLHIKAKVVMNHDSQLIFNKYFFPGWQAKVDGKKTKVETAEPFGQIKVAIPQGVHEVEFYFQETSFRMFFNILSLVSLILAVSFLFKKTNLLKILNFEKMVK